MSRASKKMDFQKAQTRIWRNVALGLSKKLFQMHKESDAYLELMRNFVDTLPRCPECHVAVAIDEDGCCTTCGSATEVAAWPDSDDVIRDIVKAVGVKNGD